jgi:hypothetical protein
MSLLKLGKTTPLTPESILAARRWFAENALACIAEVESGRVHVNDPASYFVWRRQQHDEALAGAYDHTLTFLQRAHHIQTGECVPLLGDADPNGEPRAAGVRAHPDAAAVTRWAEGKDFDGQAPLEYWDGLLDEAERQRIREEFAADVVREAPRG